MIRVSKRGHQPPAGRANAHDLAWSGNIAAPIASHVDRGADACRNLPAARRVRLCGVLLPDVSAGRQVVSGGMHPGCPSGEGQRLGPGRTLHRAKCSIGPHAAPDIDDGNYDFRVVAKCGRVNRVSPRRLG
ncbi:hypothetical protein Voc01_076470 [Virgisporangium ochraceum]|uniref:Uncharacterized protein n=1 Tax=Virgisporangium ochraceum TaxID=65505 RepID=A0A8J4EEM6_9ACTN|nr:hypothetical protein Voc01_076470 [Virgisporangium ochraceum]